MASTLSPLRPDLFMDHVVLVSGASGGIGRAVASAFRSHGAYVVGLDLKQHSDGSDCHEQVQFDLRDLDGLREAVDGVAARQGRIDALVHCAAVYRREPNSILASASTWTATIEANVLGMLELDRAALRWLRPGSSVVHVSSVRGRTAARGAVAYGVSKAMTDQATKMLALEWAARGVRVNAVAPGDIETPMNPQRPDDPAQLQLLGRCPMRRMGQPQEVAGAILFLCSPLASFVHGTTLFVDGGFLVH